MISQILLVNKYESYENLIRFMDHLTLKLNVPHLFQQVLHRYLVQRLPWLKVLVPVMAQVAMEADLATATDPTNQMTKNQAMTNPKLSQNWNKRP